MKKIYMFITLILFMFFDFNVTAANIKLEGKVINNEVVVTLYFDADKKFDAFELPFYYDSDKLNLPKTKDNLYKISGSSGFSVVMDKKLVCLNSETKGKGKYKIVNMTFSFKDDFDDNDIAYIIFDDGDYYYNDEYYSLKGQVLEIKKDNDKVITNNITASSLKNDAAKINSLINDGNNDFKGFIKKVDINNNQDNITDVPKTGCSLIIIPFLFFAIVTVYFEYKNRRKIYKI